MNIQISGNLSGPTAIFIAGWPDTCDVFRDNIMAALAADYRIVGITLPGFDDDHPFMQTLRERGLSSSFGGLSAHNDVGKPPSASTAGADSSGGIRKGGSWLPRVFPFTYFTADDHEARAAEAYHACLGNALRISCGRSPLELFHTTWKGHSFQDLTTMLEIAVDTAMETCNYCPGAIPSTATAATAATAAAPAGATKGSKGSHASHGLLHGLPGVAEHCDDGLENVPLHQLPPTYTRPVLIAHDWGCILAYELLLVRPNLFSKFVALDIGGYVFEHNAANAEKMCELVSRNEMGQTAPAASCAASSPRSPGLTNNTSAGADPPHPRSPANAKASIGGFAARDASGETEGSSSKAARQTAQGSPHSVGVAAATGEASERLKRAAEAGQTASSSSPVPQLVQPRPSRSNSIQETLASSPVTVVHGVNAGGYSGNNNNRSSIHFDMPTRVVASASQPHHSVAGASTKRSLASQYAIRSKKPTPKTQRADTRKAVVVVLYQWFLIACLLFVPFRLARWLVNCFAKLTRRPVYCYDPQIVSTPAVELLNHTLNTHFFAQHPYAIENRGAFDLPVLLQVQEGASPSSRLIESSFSSANPERPSLMRSRKLPRLLPGWKFLLIPYVEGSPVQQCRHSEVSLASPTCHRALENADSVAGVSSSRRHDARSRTLRTSTQSEHSHSYTLSNGSTTSTDFSQDDISSPLQPGNAEEAANEAAWSETAGAPITAAGLDTGYTIYSSYAKGAGLLEEWNTSLEGLGRVHASAGTSGELDPYLSVLSIPSPLWVAEDPLALTGAQSFHEPRQWGMSANDGCYLIAPDTDGAPRRNAYAATATTTSSTGGGGGNATAASTSLMQVIKRKIYYQAVAFPPLTPPKNASFSSLNGDATVATVANNNNSSLLNNDDAASSRSKQSTVLDRLRRSYRKAALRPTVPVLASPRQGWIYLRFWLGTFLMCLMAFGSWLFGQEKKPTAASSGNGEGAGSSHHHHHHHSGSGNNNSVSATNVNSGSGGNSSKAYSNVMTTAMTTIYRRLPAPPSLAASTANLPGDGDTVLQPMSYAPLVSRRYFVPLPVPVLFMYGGAKKIMFHADHWCAYVRQYQRPRDGISDVVEVQGGGHWFFAEKKYQKKVADRIAEFLAAEQKLPLGVQ